MEDDHYWRILYWGGGQGIMFAITSCKGFHMSFPNGVTLSTQFGGGNYCGNYNMGIGPEHLSEWLESEDTEIAIFETHERGEWLTRQAYKELFDEDIGDDVKGYVVLAEWLKVLDWCSTYTLKEKVDLEDEE